MSDQLSGKRVAILLTNGFEEVEMTGPRQALNDAGAETRIVSPAGDKVRSWRHTEWGEFFPVDQALDDAKSDDYDALLLPGGVINPDALRMQPKAVAFAQGFVDAGKPIGAICHGPWTLVETGLPEGKTMTSWPSLKTDLENAGATWVDKEVVVDQGIVTSRKPDDIPAFSAKLIEEISEGQHKRDAA